MDEDGAEEDLGIFIYLFIVTFHCFGIWLYWNGDPAHWPTGPTPQTLLSPAPTHLSTCFPPTGLGVGVQGRRADTWELLTHITLTNLLEPNGLS